MADNAPLVLLAEEDLFFQARILSVLKRLGYRVDTATLPETALEKARSESPALVILSLASPRLGGVDLVRRLKTESPESRILAYLSHVKIPAARAAALAAGTDKLVPNSAITLRLPRIVEEILHGRIEQAVEEEEE